MDEEPSYDAVQAKFCASLLWFVCRISENEACEIPPEITSPIDISTANTVLVHPAVVDYLTSGEMYFKVAQCIYNKKHFQSFWDLIQFMTQKSVYVIDENSESVTDQDLMERYPFKMSSHIALIDAMMLSYVNFIVSTQDIVNSVKRFSSFNASKELPFDIEGAILLWLNKVNRINTNRQKPSRHHQQPILPPSSSEEKRIRVRKDLLVEKKVFPEIRHLRDALNDGRTLLSIILLYFPAALKIEDIRLSMVLTDDEKLANIELFRSMCAENVCTSVFALRIEDFYFSKDYLKSNFLALLCEIFTKVENIEPRTSFTQDTVQKYPIENMDNRSNKDLMYQHNPTKEPSVRSDSSGNYGNQHSHLPLLSKRSKKQFAKFEGAISQDVPLQNNAIQMDDLELKQSCTIPSTMVDRLDTQSLQAWGPNDGERNKKQAKISLDFKPDIGSLRPGLRSSSIDTSHAQHVADNLESAPKVRSYEPQTQQQQQQHSEFASSSYPDTGDINNISAEWEDVSKSVHNYFKDDSILHEERIQTPKIGPPMEGHYTTPLSADSSSTMSDYKKLSSMYSLVANEPELLTSSTDCSPEKLTAADFQHGAPPDDLRHLIMQPSSSGDFQHKYEDDDDALSTITEATEPDLYSLRSSIQSSSSVQSSSSTLHSENKSSLSNSYISSSTERQQAHDRRIKEEKHKEDLRMDPLSLTPERHQSLVAAVGSVTGTSYTINEGTVENALASGLPIITQSSDIKNTIQYVDLNSSQEVCGMDAEGSPILQRSVRTDQPLHSYDAMKDIHEMRDPEASHSEYLKRTSQNVTNSMKAYENASFIDTSIFDRQHSGYGKHDTETIRSSILENIQSLTSSLNSSQHYSSRHSNDTERGNNLNETNLKSSFQEQYKTNATNTSNVSKEDKRQQNIVDSNSTSSLLSSHDKKLDYFSSVSYNHWPFGKQSQENTFTIRRNGEDVYFEKLNPRNKERNSSPVLTSWMDVSKNTTKNLSLEERELRLKKIQERRLKTTSSTSRQMMTWADVPHQHEANDENVVVAERSTGN